VVWEFLCVYPAWYQGIGVYFFVILRVIMTCGRGNRELSKEFVEWMQESLGGDRHKLIDLLLIGWCSITACGEGFDEMEELGSASKRPRSGLGGSGGFWNCLKTWGKAKQSRTTAELSSGGYGPPWTLDFSAGSRHGKT
jgi:hypothetical protein